MRSWRGVSLSGCGYLGRIQAMGYTQEWYDSYNTAIRVTPERAWSIPE
jgi:hypothetical protein